MLQLDDQV